MIQTMTSKARPTVHERDTLVFNALTIAPIPIIGAKHANLSIITVACCTICTSLVERVIRDAVEKSSSSAAENAVTFLNNALLISLDDFADTLEAKKLPASEHNTVPAETASIIRPVFQI